MLEERDTTAPDSGLPNLEEILQFGGTISQSQGQVMWWAVDLAPANYGAFCFIPDPRYEGVSHSAMDMVGSFTVA